MLVYVTVGSADTYDGFFEWPVAVFFDFGNAQAWARKAYKRSLELRTNSDYNEINEYDPYALGSEARYTVHTRPLMDDAQGVLVAETIP